MHTGTSCLLVAVLLAVTVPAFAAEPATPRPPTLFAALDADGDGRFTAAELQSAREQQIARFDADRDGGYRRPSIRHGLDAAQPRLARRFRADDRDRTDESGWRNWSSVGGDAAPPRHGRDGALSADECGPADATQPVGVFRRDSPARRPRQGQVTEPARRD